MSKFFKVYSGPGYPVDPKLEQERQWEAWVKSLPPVNLKLHTSRVPRIYTEWLQTILNHRN